MKVTTSVTGLKRWALILALWFILQVSPLRAQYSPPLTVTGTGVDFEFRASGVLISTGSFQDSSLLTSDQGAGTRFLWWPGQAAFRAGSVGGTQWDSSNIGMYSAACGYNTIAFGYASTAFGTWTTASGDYSTASGSYTQATKAGSTAFGIGAAALGFTSVAFGYYTTASAYDSSAFGCLTTASGYYSTAFGHCTTASAEYSFVIGAYNVGGAGPTVSGTDPVFEIGNGYYNSTTSTAVPSDALVVYRNGSATFQGPVTVAPGGDIPMFSGY